MIKKQSKQSELEFVTIDQLVPKDHLVRKIDKFVDFSFIDERVASLYCHDNGRPAIDPEVLFKMTFLGYIFGIRSERQLVREIETNVAYRWFVNFKLLDKVPHHSTFSKNRKRRFDDSDIYKEIFDDIVFQCIEMGLVDGKILYTDSTHMKANANKKKFEKVEVEKSTKAYLDELNEDINKDREANGKKPLKKKEETPENKTIKVSTVDPESGHMVRDGKPKGFFYLDHRTVDGKCNIITDTHVTPGNVHDSRPYLGRLDHICNLFDFELDAVGLDAGYNTAAICKGLVDRNIYGTIGYRRPNQTKGLLRKNQFKYDHELDCYICPNNQYIHYSTTNRDGYREYKSDSSMCKYCPFLDECTKSKNQTKVVTRHIWQPYKDEIDSHRFEEKGREIYKRRKETVERSFANAKELHGHRYARFRGLKNVQNQCLLAAASQNMKKMALILDRISA